MPNDSNHATQGSNQWPHGPLEHIPTGTMKLDSANVIFIKLEWNLSTLCRWLSIKWCMLIYIFYDVG